MQPNLIQTTISIALDRCEKIERAGVNSIPDVENRLATLRLLNETFQLIRSDPPSAYVRLMKAALAQPSSAKTEYINRIALLARLSGYALMNAMRNEDIFNRVMEINEKPVTT